MNITPLDLLHQEFTGALSGYSRREVKAFLIQVSEQLESVLRENQQLKEQQGVLERQIETLKQGEEELRRVVVSAERIAHELKVNAEKEAGLLLQDAQLSRDKLVHEAETLRDRMLLEANEKREALLRETRDAVARMESELEQARSERAQFIAQYRGLLQGFMSLADRYDVGD